MSLLMHVAFAVGVAFWFALGMMLWNWPMMNALTLMLTVIIVTMGNAYAAKLLSF